MRLKRWNIVLPLLVVAFSETPAVGEAATSPVRGQQVQIVAKNMTSKECAQKVAGQLYAAPGVSDVQADLDNKTVAVTVSRQKGATLEQLWQAVVAGEGDPTKLTTAEATFTLTPPAALAGQSLPAQGTTYVVIDNLHCKGCAQKIAAQFYTLRGVSKVKADMKKNMLTITSKGQELSPWALVGAVTRAKERPVVIVGSSGRMDIAWSAPKTKSAHQASSPANRKVQR